MANVSDPRLNVSSEKTMHEKAIENRSLRHIKVSFDDNEEDPNAQFITTQIPKDHVIISNILNSMGVKQYNPQIIYQLHEYIHRYMTDILVDAQEMSAYAKKSSIDADDIRLAIESRLNQPQTKVPSREITMEIAAKRNSIPLPAISNEYGVRLPPIQYQLMANESERHEDKKHIGFLKEQEIMKQENQSFLPLKEGSRNKTIAANQIRININKN